VDPPIERLTIKELASSPRIWGDLMPTLKNQRQEVFSQNLTKGMTGDKAYIQAGYKPNRHNPSRLKANETIKSRVAEIREETAQALILERQYRGPHG